MNMNLQETEYAIAKQIPLGSDEIILKTDCGELVLTGDIGRKAVKALRLILMAHGSRLHKETVKS